jgi:hypothetical protein
MDFTIERKQVHEISNHLTIIHGAVKKVLKELEKAEVLESEQERLKKADEYLKLTTQAIQVLRDELLHKTNSGGGKK